MHCLYTWSTVCHCILVLETSQNISEKTQIYIGQNRNIHHYQLLVVQVDLYLSLLSPIYYFKYGHVTQQEKIQYCGTRKFQPSKAQLLEAYGYHLP